MTAQKHTRAAKNKVKPARKTEWAFDGGTVVLSNGIVQICDRQENSILELLPDEVGPFWDAISAAMAALEEEK